MKHVAIAGATDGIGLALAQEYARLGWRVALLGRAPRLDEAVASTRAVSAGQTVVGIPWDATDPGRAGPAFDEAARALGQVDLFVYNAGIMLTGADPEARGEAAARMMEVNVSGAIRILEHAAAYMEAARRGRIAGVGSIAGDRGRKGNPSYCASKAALDTYLEGLRHRLFRAGVGVSSVRPGYVRTKLLRADIPSFPPTATTETAARVIVRQLARGRDVFYVPRWWAPIAWVMRFTPRFLFKRFGPP